MNNRIEFRTRIYLPEKYSPLLTFFKKKIKRRNAISIFIEKCLDLILQNVPESEWEKTLNRFLEGKSHPGSVNDISVRIHEEDYEETTQVSLNDILL